MTRTTPGPDICLANGQNLGQMFENRFICAGLSAIIMRADNIIVISVYLYVWVCVYVCVCLLVRVGVTHINQTCCSRTVHRTAFVLGSFEGWIHLVWLGVNSFGVSSYLDLSTLLLNFTLSIFVWVENMKLRGQLNCPLSNDDTLLLSCFHEQLPAAVAFV